MRILRTWSSAGPCITEGRVVGETATFWKYQEWRGHNSQGEAVYDEKIKRMAKVRSCNRPHVEPCNSCRDHPKTQYPNGYMD